MITSLTGNLKPSFPLSSQSIMSGTADFSPFPDPVPLPVSGELDLHTFRPRDLGSLLPEYFHECRQRGILTVRIVHGKGTGALRASVHALLGRLPEVREF